MAVGPRTIATHLPLWGDAKSRVIGPDEDAITLAVAAGVAALEGYGGEVGEVVLVTRDLPQLEGSSTGPLIAALGLPESTRATIVLGGAPQSLDAVTYAPAGTLVIAAETGALPGSAAVLVAEDGLALTPLGRTDRSLPVHVRDASGHVFDYEDARLVRERSVVAGVARLGLAAKPVAVAGLRGKDAATVTVGGAPVAPTLGATASFFALAGLAEQRSGGPLIAIEESTLVAVEVGTADVAVRRHEPAPLPLPKRRMSSEANIAISLPAYERAFDAKLRLAAGKCTNCGTLALPPRLRCIECGNEKPYDLVPLPRNGSVYTTVTVRVPVPGLRTPYSLAIVELGDTGVRLLTHVADAEPASVSIGDLGTLVLRRIAIRAGIPDYGYAFIPEHAHAVPAATATKAPATTAVSGGPA
jgi:uncharacterized OB-fold protein